MYSINLQEKFGLFDDHWNPKIIGELNGQAVKIAKVLGEFVWHNHANEDELFYVVKGQLKILFKDSVSILNTGEMCIVPRGVEHKPVAEKEVWLLLFEPIATKHTGIQITERTVIDQEKI